MTLAAESYLPTGCMAGGDPATKRQRDAKGGSQLLLATPAAGSGSWFL